ncbi:MAG: lysophospholipid acyltransferase family protein [Nannocystaceae bacterium]
MPPRHSPAGDLSSDDFPFAPVDPATLRAAAAGFDVLARYHRLEVRGLERIPKGPAIFVGNHNGGFNPVDGLFLVHYYRRFGYDEAIYILAHDILFRVPRMAELLHSVGIIPAHRESARAVLEAGHKLLVFPGGDIENMRPFSQRRRVVLGGRQGFARLALQTGVPILPVVSAGSHETLVVLSQGRRLARAIGADRLARIHSLPLIFALPWGLLFGPMAALPYLPLPSKVTVQIGHTIEPAAWESMAEPAPLADQLYLQVEQVMQYMLSELYEERTLPVLG